MAGRGRAGALVALAACLVLAVATGHTARETTASAQTPPVVARADAPLPAATVEGVTLLAPVPAPVLVGFHEVCFARALPLVPTGTLRSNQNPKQVAVPPASPGPSYIVMASRDRPTPATSAVDFVVGPQEPVLSPVTGIATEAGPYLLYGIYADRRVRIQPADNPAVLVSVEHLGTLQVEAGQQVVAGTTVLASGPNAFPFVSEIDQYLDGTPHTHVHYEAAPISEPIPPC